MEHARLYRAGADAVQKLIARYDLHARSALPVPIRQVARDEGWEVAYSETLAPLYGYAVVHHGVRFMRINARVVESYQRMAIAHEMGHVLNGDTGQLYLCSSRSDFTDWLFVRQERQASLAAATILIPAWITGEIGDAELIARTCEVPLELVDLFLGTD